MSLHQMGIYPEDPQVIDQLVAFVDSKESSSDSGFYNERTAEKALLDLENYIEQV